jgi:hypothetical protein
MGNSQPRSSILGDEPQRRHSTFIHKPIIDYERERGSSIKTGSIHNKLKRVPIGSSALMDEPTLGNKPQSRHYIKTGSKRVPIGSSAFIHEPTIDEPQVIHKSISYYSQPKAVTDYRQDLNDLSYGIIYGEYSTIFTEGGRYEKNPLEFYSTMIRNQDKFIDWLTTGNNAAEFLKGVSRSQNLLTRIYDSHIRLLQPSEWNRITLTECGKDVHIKGLKTCPKYQTTEVIRTVILQNIEFIQKILKDKNIGKSIWNFKRRSQRLKKRSLHTKTYRLSSRKGSRVSLEKRRSK